MKLWKAVLLVGGCLLGLLSAGLNLEKADASSFHLSGKVETLLLAGLDRDPESKSRDRRTDLHTDSLVLLRTREGSGEVDALHIPRDTLVYIPGVGREKINAVLMFQGEKALMRALRQLTGWSVDAVIYTDFPQFRAAFRRLGNIPFVVDREITTSDEKLRIAPGRHTLTADEVLAVARFRYEPLGDIGRVRRQARMLQAALACLRQLPYPAYQEVVKRLDPAVPAAVAEGAYRVLQGMKSYHAYMLPGRFGTGAENGDFIADPVGMGVVGEVMEALGAAKPQAARLRRLDARDVGGVQIL